MIDTTRSISDSYVKNN
eukprot:Gb_35910 [translate_table: standard]